MSSTHLGFRSLALLDLIQLRVDRLNHVSRVLALQRTSTLLRFLQPCFVPLDRSLVRLHGLSTPSGAP